MVYYEEQTDSEGEQEENEYTPEEEISGQREKTQKHSE